MEYMNIFTGDVKEIIIKKIDDGILFINSEIMFRPNVYNTWYECFVYAKYNKMYRAYYTSLKNNPDEDDIEDCVDFDRPDYLVTCRDNGNDDYYKRIDLK